MYVNSCNWPLPSHVARHQDSFKGALTAASLQKCSPVTWKAFWVWGASCIHQRRCSWDHICVFERDKILTSLSFLLNYPIEKDLFPGIEMGGNDFIVLAILSLLPQMPWVLFPFHVEHAFHKVLQQDHCNTIFLKDGFTVLHLLNLQHASLEGGLEKRSVVCFLQREVWQKMLSKDWLHYCPAPCSECIQQYLSYRVAFHWCRYEIAQGEAGVTPAFAWALL